MATRAQVAYLGEDMDRIVTTYNHYDGYPTSLGVALKNHFNDDLKAKDIASSGYISYIDSETGEVDARHKQSPTEIIDGDLDTLLRMWYDDCKDSGAEYAYLWNGRKWCAYRVPSEAGQDKFVNYFMSEIDSKSDLNENKDSKRWAMLAGLPKTDKTQLDENIVGMEMIGNIFDREKEKYEDAFEYFLAEKVEIQSEDRKAKEYIQSIEDEEEREEEKERMFGEDEEIEETDMPLDESLNPEVSKAVNRFIKGMAKKYSYSEQDAVYAIMAALKQRDFDGLNESQLNEYTENNFSGNALIAQTPQPGRDELATYDYFFPDGVASRSNAISSLQAHDESPIKARMGRYAPMFAHVQYHEFEDEAAEKYRVHQTQYYNNNFADKDPNFNPRVTKLTLFKLTPSGDTDKEVDMGSILVKTDEYIKDLKNLNITNKQS